MSYQIETKEKYKSLIIMKYVCAQDIYFIMHSYLSHEIIPYTFFISLHEGYVYIKSCC